MKSTTTALAAIVAGLFSVALVAGCQRDDPAPKRVSFQHFEVNHEGFVIVHSREKPDAKITAAGDLTIAGQAIATTPAQRLLLQRYYAQVHGIRGDAIATGKQGVALAGKAISEVVGGLMAGDPDRISKRVEAEAGKVEASAAQICVRLGAIRTAQEALVAELPAFRPYATIGADAGSDCHVDFESSDSAGSVQASALIEAVDTRRVDEVRRVVEQGADIDATVRGDGTALIRAAAHGDLAVVDELIRLGADVNRASGGDGNPLIAAAKGGHADVVARLVAAGADVDGVVADDETPLINAARGGHLAVVTYLVEHGADVNKGVVADLGRWRSPLNQAADDQVRAYLSGKGAVAGRES